MVKEPINGVMVGSLSANIKMTRKTDKVFTCGLMEEHIMVNGVMVSNMEMVSILC